MKKSTLCDLNYANAKKYSYKAYTGTVAPRGNTPGYVIQALRTLSAGVLGRSEKGPCAAGAQAYHGQRHGCCIVPRLSQTELHPERDGLRAVAIDSTNSANLASISYGIGLSVFWGYRCYLACKTAPPYHAY